MINKYQAGGATQGSILQEIAKLPQDQQKKIMVAFGKWALAKGLNIQLLQGNEQALEQAMGQFLQELQGAQKARLGAKLNYLRSIKGDCPEGQEVKYFKEGGRVCKKCVEAAGGAKVKDGKKEIADFKKACGGKTKKACGGTKVSKNQMGGGMIRRPIKEDPTDAMHVGIKRPRQVTIKGVMTEQKGGKAPEDKKGLWTKEDDKKLLKYRLKGTKNSAEKKDSTDVQTKWNKLPEKVKKQHEVQEEKCGGKAKKHFFGGILGF